MTTCGSRLIGRSTVAAIVGVAGLAWTGAAVGQGSSEHMMTATIRDFSDSHPDFCRNTSVGSNWVEGSVAPQLGVGGRPVYTGGGRRVTIPASDAAGNHIANSLIESTVLVEPQNLVLSAAPSYSNNPKVDTYNPALGPYGGANVGPEPSLVTGAVMPQVVVPALGSYVLEYLRDGNAQSVLNTSFRCGKFLVRNNHTLTIQGDVTIVVEDSFVIENFAKIYLAPGATFTVYALKDAKFQNFAELNMNTWDHTRVTFYKVGPLDVYFQDNSKFCGTIICPDGRVFMHNQPDVYGVVTAEQLHMQNSSRLHIAEPTQTECSTVSDTPAQFGAVDTGAVTSGASFDQWFQDSPGVNESAQARMRFTKDATGAWEFEAPDFRPIDGKLMGAGQYGANRNFTLDLDGQFTYTPCTSQFLEFAGDGDAMVYVDGELVLELSGNNAGVSQRVDLDRLGLDPGQPHTLQFFYAQRSCAAAPFSLRTNVTLDTEYKVVAAAVSCFD